MLAYPEVNMSIAELDDVIGSARPPAFADLPSPLYLSARWSKRHRAGRPRLPSACLMPQLRMTGTRACSFPRARSASRTCACSILTCMEAVTRRSSTGLGVWTRRVGSRCWWRAARTRAVWVWAARMPGWVRGGRDARDRLCDAS
jgi:hypothetical protein